MPLSDRKEKGAEFIKANILPPVFYFSENPQNLKKPSISFKVLISKNADFL